jgi:nicotinamide phosphoribosyltransferase
MNALFLTDGYKTGHHIQYPKGTQEVYSNWTARSDKHAPAGCENIVSMGQQYVIKWLHHYFQDHFFNKAKAEVCGEMKAELSLYLGAEYEVSHFEQLHDLQYLPIKIKSLPEGLEVPMRVPLLTVVNTLPAFYWVTNFLETILSSVLWQPMTSATIALRYKRIFKEWALRTDQKNIGFIDFQGHDFSMRGMGGLESACASGIGHAAVFSGSDSLPVIHTLRKYYNAQGFVVGSVNATEHSVMCAGTKEDEADTFRSLISTYPKGILSIVSDTWDLWNVIENILPKIKEDVMRRDGKIVIRPDSGDPVEIICGTSRALGGKTAAEKGVIELLWELFGGEVNSQGFKVLDSHIGAIYGDSITTERAQAICQRLFDKGFASTNIVLGIGSFTYQFNTRDTFGFAMKATSVVVNNERRDIFKDPITDDGIKKSAKGLMRVNVENGVISMTDQVNESEEASGALKVIYENGHFKNLSDLIPKADHQHRNGFTNQQLVLALTESEKIEVEKRLIEMLSKSNDTLIGETLATLKSTQALEKLSEKLNLANSSISKIIWASFINEIKEGDYKMKELALNEFDNITENYTRISGFYKFSKFRDPRINEKIRGFINHPDYLTAYNARTSLGIDTKEIIARERSKNNRD